MNFVGAFATANAGAKLLKVALHKALAGDEQPRSVKVVHASAVTGDFCPRQYALFDKFQIKGSVKHVPTSLALTYKIGHAVQRLIIDVLCESHQALTHWRCDSCNAGHLYSKLPYKCSTCGCRSLSPEEIRFQSELTGISGGIDVVADVGDGQFRMVEIKTIAPEEFKKLIAPLAEHKQRTNLYMRVAAESEDPFRHKLNLNLAHLLYVSKGGYGVADSSLMALGVQEKFSPFKEFVIQRDDKATEALCVAATSLLSWRKGLGPLPDRICGNQFDKRAQYCPACKPCFTEEGG